MFPSFAGNHHPSYLFTNQFLLLPLSAVQGGSFCRRYQSRRLRGSRQHPGRGGLGCHRCGGGTAFWGRCRGRPRSRRRFRRTKQDPACAGPFLRGCCCVLVEVSVQGDPSAVLPVRPFLWTRHGESVSSRSGTVSVRDLVGIRCCSGPRRHPLLNTSEGPDFSVEA